MDDDYEEDYEDMMKRKEKEKNRQHLIDEKIPVPEWVQARFDAEEAERERKRLAELGDSAEDEKPSLTKLPGNAAELLFSFGLEGNRRANVAYVAEDVLIHTCGNAIHFLTISTKEQTFLKSKAGRGIGAVAVHPNRTCLAVCEKGTDPDIYIYAYPSLEQTKVMTNGTEKVFSAANFNKDGTRLATVGGHPDYWLTVWDWANESMILRSKAFSQEIFKVTFSQYFPGQLITSGVGHIRFWKMASTFTGLKLEGAIAKFGTVSISDVAGYVELQNSKVLSGTETGTILVWDDGLIKAQLKMPGDFNCHKSMIEFIILDEEIKEMTTAGADGYIKFWNLDNGKWLEAANDGDDKLVCEINPIREVYMGEGVHIKGIIREEGHWIIQDDGGALWRAELPGFELKKVLEFHAGAITCVASSPINYDLVSGGSDGTVRLYSFKSHQVQYLRRFNSGVSSLLWMPLLLDPKGTSLIVGFKDGVVRILKLTEDQWKLSSAMKPHKAEVTSVSVTPDADLLATGSKDATIFFFHATNEYKALGFCKVPGPVSSIAWSWNGQDLLVGCSSGHIVEIARPGFDMDISKSYELDLEVKNYTFHRPLIKRPKPKPIVKKVEEPKEEYVPVFDEWGDEIFPDEIIKQPGSEETPTTQEEGAKRTSVIGGRAMRASIEAGVKRASQLAAATERKSSKVPVQTEGAGEAVVEGDKPPDGSSAVFREAPPADAVPPPVVDEDIDRGDEPGTLFPVRAIMYALGDLSTFYVAFEGKPAGFIFECQIFSEDILGYTQWLECPVKCFGYTHSLQYIVSGSDDGMVRVQEVPVPGQIQLSVTQSKFWEGGVHDGFYGVVGGAVTSFDDKYLASVSSDGSFFVQSLDMFMGTDVPRPSVPSEKKIQKEPAGLGEGDDVSLGALSIEDQRAKTEQDEKLRLALEKKNVVLAKVASIRKRLDVLMKGMNERERNERLPLTDFEIDPHVRIMKAEETAYEVDMAEKEMQWDSEKRKVALHKLKAWYLDPLEVERIVLYGFRSGQCVNSFRTARISPQLWAAIEEARKQKGVRRWTKLNKGKRSFQVPDNVVESEDTEAEPKSPSSEEGTTDADSKPAEEFSRLEQRRLMLKQREKEMTKYLLTRPDETWVSEEDAEDIQWAEANKGDFKLKSDPKYVVPEEQRTNARMKQNEMLLFTEEIHRVRMTFNQEFLTLRDHKMVLREQILENNARIEKINEALKVVGKPEPNLAAPGRGKLGSILSGAGKLSSTWKRVLSLIKDDSVFVPVIKKEERPEDREVISNDEAEVFEENRILAAEAVVKASKTTDTVGMDQSSPKKEEKPGGTSKFKNLLSREKEQPKASKKQVAPAPTAKGYPTSALEQQEQDMTQMKLKYEKKKLEEKNISIIQGFDDAVEDLKLKRFNLEINVKSAELKMMSLYQEMRYLQRIQPIEELLDEKLYQKMKAVHEVNEKLSDQETAIANKKEDIANMIEKKAELARDFDSMFPDPEDPQKVILHKYYLKLVRQVKRNPDGTIAESDDDSDLEETAANDDEDDYEDDDVAEVCPPNVTPYFYEQMFKLREKRVNEEVNIKDANKVLDAMTKERDNILKKKKVIDSALESVENEIASFQKEKQFSMNDIEMVLSLRMHQIEFLEDGGLPKDMSKGLVFDNTVFQQLRDTIKEHLKTKQALKKLHRDLRKEHQTLNREKKVEEEKSSTIEARCTEVQMLKFGQTVEMSVLDAISKDIKKDTVQLKERVRSQEATHSGEISTWDKKIDKARDDLRFCTKENAALMHIIADVKTLQNKLDMSMKERVMAPLKDPLLAKRQHASQHSHLIQIINEQDREIKRIQDGISRLKNELDTTYPVPPGEDPQGVIQG